jgi:hypothetical protein
MKKTVIALSIFACFSATYGRAQEPRPNDPNARQQQIEKLEKELNQLKRLEQIESLEKQQKETAEKLERLKKGLEPGETPASDKSPRGSRNQSDQDEIDDEQRQAGGGTTGGVRTENSSESGGQQTAGEVTPSEAAAMKGPTQRDLIRSVPRPLAPRALGYLDPFNAALFDSKYARELISLAIANGALKDADGAAPPADFYKNKDFHCIVHVIRWKESDAQGPQAVEKQNWYVYNNGRAKGFNRTWSQEDFATENRVFGVSKVWLLYVHLNKWDTQNYLTRYEFDITKKTPANLENLFALAGVFSGLRGESRGGAAPAKEDIWGGGAVDVRYVPSNVTVSAKFVPLTGIKAADLVRSASGELTPETLARIDNIAKNVEPKPLDKPKTFDNEGLYWWDISAGVPIRRISQLEFQSTGNTVTAKEVNKQNVFALLNLYPFPVDVKRQTFTWVPHFVGGVAIAKQPQNQILVGAGFGPRFANFYLGALFVKEQETTTLMEGDMASPDQLANDVRKRYKAKFSFGLNLPVRGIIESFKARKE